MYRFLSLNIWALWEVLHLISWVAGPTKTAVFMWCREKLSTSRNTEKTAVWLRGISLAIELHCRLGSYKFRFCRVNLKCKGTKWQIVAVEFSAVIENGTTNSYLVSFATERIDIGIESTHMSQYLGPIFGETMFSSVPAFVFATALHWPLTIIWLSLFLIGRLHCKSTNIDSV